MDLPPLPTPEPLSESEHLHQLAMDLKLSFVPKITVFGKTKDLRNNESWKSMVRECLMLKMKSNPTMFQDLVENTKLGQPPYPWMCGDQRFYLTLNGQTIRVKNNNVCRKRKHDKI